jgi:hypothetical protein
LANSLYYISFVWQSYREEYGFSPGILPA